MSRRGFTLLELVVSLAIASSVAIASVGLMRSVTGSFARQAERSRWLTAADSALVMMEVDLNTGDFAVRNAPDGVLPRVEVHEHAVGIQTRIANRPSKRIYEYKPDLGCIVVRGEHLSGRGERVLLEGVTRWNCEYTHEMRLLHVELAGKDGAMLTREMRAP